MGQQSEKGMDRWVAFPYVQGRSEPITNILRPLQIKVAHRSVPWRWSICYATKDRIPAERHEDIVYSIKCGDCDTTYIGETMRTLDARMKEDERHTIRGETSKSAVAEHSRLLDHTID